MITSIGLLKRIDVYFITLLRHGESEGNLAGVIQGQSDFALTDTGIDQAKQLASYWKSEGIHFDHIISSPLLRAKQTADIIATALGLPLDHDPTWMERNFGELQGLSLAEINKMDPPVDFFHPTNPIGVNGESQVDLYRRASLALHNILHFPQGSYLVVSHGGILNKALFVIIGLSPQANYHSPIFHFGNTGYAQFRYNPTTQHWAVLGLNNQARAAQNEENTLWKID